MSDLAGGTATVPEAAGSPLAALRQKLHDKQHATTVDIPLPGALSEELAVRYHAIVWERDQEIRERERPAAGRRRNIEIYMDELINACDCFLVPGAEGKWEPLDVDGKQVRFDRNLADGLGIPHGAQGGQPVDTHVIARGVFALAAGGRDPGDMERWEQALARADHLLDTHHTAFTAWLKGGADIGLEGPMGEEFLGE